MESQINSSFTVSKTIFDEFIDFYKSKRGVMPSDDIKKLFLELTEGDENETD